MPARSGALPDLITRRAVAWCAAAFRRDIGQRRDADNTKARAILGFDSRPSSVTLLDCARSLLEARHG